MPDTTDSSLTVRNERPYALISMTGPDSPLAVAEHNLGGSALRMDRLTRVTIPGGGGRQWAIKGSRGEERIDEIVGVIMHSQTSRTYYREAYSGGGTSPNCSSNDGLVGKPGVDGITACALCPKNVFETAISGRGKACSEYTQLYVAMHHRIMPIVVRISPGSLRSLDDFMQQLSSEMLRRDRVEIAIGLEDGGGYSRASFRLVRELDEDEAESLQHYIERFGALVRGNTAPPAIVVDQGVEPAYADEEPPPHTEAPADLIDADALPFE